MFTCHLGPLLALLPNIVNHDCSPLYVSSLGLLKHLLRFSLSFELDIRNATREDNEVKCREQSRGCKQNVNRMLKFKGYR